MKKPLKSFLNLCLLLFITGSCQLTEKKEKKDPIPTEKTSFWKVPSKMTDDPEREKQIRYGEKLVTYTPSYLSPSAPDSELRVAGNHLACTNCHLQSGKAPFAIGFIGIHRDFPKMYAPLNRKVTLGERIQACFKGSLNGTKPIPLKEENAMLAYLEWLGSEVPESAPIPLPEAGLPLLTQSGKGDINTGKPLYDYHCAACHGKTGQGMRANEKDFTKGYTFPPLWGTDSYGVDSSMADLRISARYIHKNMPLGRALLTENEALDIAAYVHDQNRPFKKKDNN